MEAHCTTWKDGIVINYIGCLLINGLAFYQVLCETKLAFSEGKREKSGNL